MALDVLCQGRLVKPAETRQAKNGRDFVTAQLAVAVDGDDTALVSVIGFRKEVVAALQALDAGDAVCVAGRAKLTAWPDKTTGEPRAGLSVVVEQVLTPYHVQRKRRAAQGDADGSDDAGHRPASDRRATRLNSSRSGQFKPETLREFADGVAAMADDDPFGV